MSETKTINLGNGRTKVIEYYPMGGCDVIYYKNNQLHREDGPAAVWYNEDGTIERESYYQHSICHRIDGPAVIWYNKNGTIADESYYIANRWMRKSTFQKEILKKKLQLIK